ncbi:hypothetical protein AVEN_217206-1 [Araneus ventricosus]|uniref:Uncharacterized protein n=1 Tax=Araneus ventricosus TaxID=182803 RepID=A0A4Y2QZ02_ARAVE|nr:hypothetical protein AVEN_217206-1 [Araneus ventricosus]
MPALPLAHSIESVISAFSKLQPAHQIVQRSVRARRAALFTQHTPFCQGQNSASRPMHCAFQQKFAFRLKAGVRYVDGCRIYQPLSQSSIYLSRNFLHQASCRQHPERNRPTERHCALKQEARTAERQRSLRYSNADFICR